MSLIKDITLICGDSSDIYTFSSPDFADFGEPEWEGLWNIREKNIKGNVLTSGTLSKAPDGSNWVFRLLPEVSSTIPVGKHFLTIEVSNLSLGFRREIVQCPISILNEGILEPEVTP